MSCELVGPPGAESMMFDIGARLEANLDLSGRLWGLTQALLNLGAPSVTSVTSELSRAASHSATAGD